MGESSKLLVTVSRFTDVSAVSSSTDVLQTRITGDSYISGMLMPKAINQMTTLLINYDLNIISVILNY